MRQIRKNLFETNSSSTHAIAVCNKSDGEFENNLPKELEFCPNYFGWEFERYNDPETKASYLFMAMLDNYMCEEYIPKVTEILGKWGIEARFPEIVRKECSYTEEGYYEEILGSVEGYDLYGIDHGFELREFVKVVCNDELLLMNFLFSNESFIATGNDNTDEILQDKPEKDANVLYEYYKGN